MTCTDRNRYQSNRITAYEMEDLRKMGAWRDGRWIGVWCTTSNEFHPTSLADWRAYVKQREAEEDEF